MPKHLWAKELSVTQGKGGSLTIVAPNGITVLVDPGRVAVSHQQGRNKRGKIREDWVQIQFGAGKPKVAVERSLVDA